MTADAAIADAVKDQAAPRGSWSLPLGVGGTLLVGAVALLVRSPHTAGSWGFCPSALLGFACPGCGGLRGSYELLHGDLAAAWAYNPIVLVVLPVAVALVIRWTVDAVRRRPPWAPSVQVVVGVVIALVLYAVARNIALLTPYLGPLAVP